MKFLYTLIISALFISCKSSHSINKDLSSPVEVYTVEEIMQKSIKGRYEVFPKDEFCGLFILDGLPYDSEEIESKLNKISKAAISVVLLEDISNENLYHQQCLKVIQIKTLEYLLENKVPH